MYIKNSWTERDFAAAGFWVDNCVAIGSRKELTALAESVNAKYSIASLGEVRWVLGMLLEHDRPARTISISQEAFIDSILARFNLTVQSRCPSPRELPFPQTVLPRRTELRRWRIGHIGSSWELLRGSHSELARPFWAQPRSRPLGLVRYLKGTNQWHLTLGGKSPQIAVFTAAHWRSHRDDRRSIGAYPIKIGDGVVSLKSKKKPCVPLSSTEAEYMALCQASKEAYTQR